MNFETSIHNGQIQIKMMVKKPTSILGSKKKMTIQFFDGRYSTGNNNQFISEYYLDTFLAIPQGQGLNLAQDCCKDWFLCEANVLGVKKWIKDTVLSV